jgi:hypothetical protein
MIFQFNSLWQQKAECLFVVSSRLPPPPACHVYAHSQKNWHASGNSLSRFAENMICIPERGVALRVRIYVSARWTAFAARQSYSQSAPNTKEHKKKRILRMSRT